MSFARLFLFRSSLLLPSARAFFSFALLLSIFLVSPTTDASGEDGTALNDASSDLGKRFENLGLLYREDRDPVLQELWLLGRYHGHYHYAQGSNGESEDYETRRFRFGTQARLFEKLTIHAQAVSGSDIDPWYNGFTELWMQWAFSPEVSLTIGQQKHRFTHDRNVSSRYINYLERSMLTNMFAADYTPAITLQGKVGNVAYYSGLFSNATGQNMGEAFTDLDSGYSYLAAAYYDLEHLWNLDSAYLHATALHSEANETATNLNRFDQGLSSAAIFCEESASFIAEVTAGFDEERGNAIALNLQPGYFLTDTVQLVGRYQLAFSNEAEGLSPQRRYEDPAGLPEGDEYQAAYFGVNHYIAKHRLKLLVGLEYSTMEDEDVWTGSAMLRFYFGPSSGGAFPMNQLLPGGFFPQA